MKISIEFKVNLTAPDRGQAFVKIMDHDQELASGNSGLLAGVSVHGLASRAVAQAIDNLDNATIEAKQWLQAFDLHLLERKDS